MSCFPHEYRDRERLKGIGVEWGDVASWVGSIATSGALFLTYGLLRLSRNDQRELRAEQRQNQARKVSAWCESVEAADGGTVERVRVRLQNASDEPIYGARVAVGYDWLTAKSDYTELGLDYVIAPRYDQTHSVEIRAREPGTADRHRTLPVEIMFSDASGGRFWHRDRYGGLAEITGTLPPSGREHF